MRSKSSKTKRSPTQEEADAKKDIEYPVFGIFRSTHARHIRQEPLLDPVELNVESGRIHELEFRWRVRTD